MSDPPVTPLAELDALCAWLRGGLRQRLDALRADSEAGPRRELDAWIEPAAATAPGPPPIPAALAALAERLELRTDERSIVAVLLAVAVEPGLGAALGTLCDPLGRSAVTRDAIARALGLPSTHRLTAEDASSRMALIVRTDAGLVLDPAIEARLLGRPGRDGSLMEHLAVIPRRPPLPDWPVDALAMQVRRAIAAGARGVRLWIRGSEGSGRRTLFASVAHAVGLVAAVVGPDAAGALRAALRLARLDDLALAWTDRVRLPPDLPVPALQAWLDPEPPLPWGPGVAELTVRMPTPDGAGRRHAWQTLVPAFERWPETDRAMLVEGWSARPAQLAAVAHAGVTTAAEAAVLLRIEATQRIEGHAEVLETPFEWDDLVLPTPLLTSLREIAFEARALPALWDEPRLGRIFPQGRAIAALFSGPPGTGKTMAAQVIARAIGLPLFRVDLSRIVSKYIGETSQNLGRVLAAAHHTDAVVFFDEADALFGKRTEVRDAHDRYANTETDYLLQALDAWRGVALLATNKRGNIDAAFMRRMRIILEFPRNDAAGRLRLWTRLVTAIVPDRGEALGGTVARLAASVELTGAQIKDALLTARLVAMQAGAAVAPEHLVRGLERALEKDGRSLDAHDRGGGPR